VLSAATSKANLTSNHGQQALSRETPPDPLQSGGLVAHWMGSQHSKGCGQRLTNLAK